MYKFFCYFLAIIITSSCSPKVEDNTVRNWEILALERQVVDLNQQNEALSLILKKMTSTHTSIRFFAYELVNDIEKVKNHLIDYSNNESKPEVTTSYQMISTKGRIYPRSFVFKHKEIPKKLTGMVVKTLSSFDNHPDTKGDCLNSFLLEIDHENPKGIIEKEMFDGLNLGQTVQLLELVQIRILMEENRYLTNQFDNAILRVIAFPQDIKL